MVRAGPREAGAEKSDKRHPHERGSKEPGTLIMRPSGARRVTGGLLLSNI